MVLEVPPNDFVSDTGSSAIWHDAMADTTPTGISSVTLLPLSSKYELFSNFGEKDCGEPSKSQHLVFDFTPDPDIDNEESQLKCCEFWDFINSKAYMRDLCVIPSQERHVATKHKPTTEYVEFPNTGATSFINRDPQDFVELGLEEKMPASKCTLGDGSYSEIDPTIRKPAESTSQSSKPAMCTCSKICAKCKKSKPQPPQSNSKAKEMCKIFDDWDKKHPKSMDPPGPVMQHMPILQRKLPPPQDPKTCFD